MTGTCRCGKIAEGGTDQCFLCRVRSVGFTMHGPANIGNFHETKTEWMMDNFGTTSERELAERGIERAPK